jgi:hypothetical protein
VNTGKKKHMATLILSAGNSCQIFVSTAQYFLIHFLERIEIRKLTLMVYMDFEKTYLILGM